MKPSASTLERELPAAFVSDVRRATNSKQLGLLRLLALEVEAYPWKEAALRLIGSEQAWLRNKPSYEHCVLFTGHMIDAPGRPLQRFPPSAEAAVQSQILSALQTVRSAHPGSVVGVAGGANGGDILFHEACFALGIPTLLRLTLPRDIFVETSVAPAGFEWVRRFDAIIDRLGSEGIAVLGEMVNLPTWMSVDRHYDVWQRTNLWLVQEAICLAPAQTLLALWDGSTGDGPGGTQHLVRVAPDHGISVAPILRPTLF